MNKKQKERLLRIVITAVAMILLWLINPKGLVRGICYLLVYALIGTDIIKKAFAGIKNRQPFDECLLMVIATFGAICLAIYSGSGDYVEAIAVMLFYQIGEFFQTYAVGKSRKSITDLMDICPDYANIEDEEGNLEQVDCDEVETGSIIVVKPGERIPIDGTVIEGTSTVNTAALTGESVPRTVKEGDNVISGCINLSGMIRVKTTCEFEESTASKVMELIEDASSHKSKSENFISKFARFYTPVVVYLALALALVVPLIRLVMGMEPGFGQWIYRALIFLVISCPCALVISIPLSFFAGIGGAGRCGILIKGSNYMETLANAKTVVMDKTGTLTCGVFEVTDIYSDNVDHNELLHMAAHVERYSKHPIAESIKKAYCNEKDGCTVSDIEEISGQGVKALVNGRRICVGNSTFMENIGSKWHECDHNGTAVHVTFEEDYAGHIIISDKVKAQSKGALESLKKCGVNEIVMLTGDVAKAANTVAEELGITRVHSDLLPTGKLETLEKIMSEKKDKKDSVIFVGDGINDAPVLKRADVGIAMGALGQDAAIEAADVVLMDDDPGKIAVAIKIARKCLSIVKENIWFAIGVKVICLILGALGIANMWFAIFADVGVMVVAVLNAIRCMYVKRIENV
ncbi:MAG: cadmium-translocating P-type ATPase [Lachnospiraceae bacterium]|nr:cadmium-translocating P-type ATPase [Lachnospiraceae bacterium]